jgi:glycosyltransferase involved in cell wall biosynthesis
VRQALRHFQRQTYQDSELVVLDDGDDSVRDLCDATQRVRYVRLEKKTSVGTKMNIGVGVAQGSILQKLDDDDYYGARFLETSVNQLARVDRVNTVVTWCCFLVLLLEDGQLRYSGHGWNAGATLCFSRDVWKVHPFRDVPTGEDYWFLKDNHFRVSRVCDPELLIAVRHGANTWKTTKAGMSVEEVFSRKPQYSKSLARLLSEEDLSFYQSMMQKKE